MGGSLQKVFKYPPITILRSRVIFHDFFTTPQVSIHLYNKACPFFFIFYNFCIQIITRCFFSLFEFPFPTPRSRNIQYSIWFSMKILTESVSTSSLPSLPQIELCSGLQQIDNPPPFCRVLVLLSFSNILYEKDGWFQIYHLLQLFWRLTFFYRNPAALTPKNLIPIYFQLAKIIIKENWKWPRNNLFF